MHELHNQTVWYEQICPQGVDDVSDLLGALEQYSDQGRLLFRGEKSPFDHPWLPNIARSFTSFTAWKPDARLTIEEIAEIKKAQVELSWKSVPKEHSDWIPFAQHHGYNTRLLDVTLDPLVALYFAAQRAKNEADGFVWFLFPRNYCPQRRRQKDIPKWEIEIPLPDRYDALFENTKNHWVQIEKPDRVYLLEPPIPNTRIVAQKAALIWWPSIGEMVPGLQICPIRIPGTSKGKLLEQLAQLHFTKRTLFPD